MRACVRALLICYSSCLHAARKLGEASAVDGEQARVRCIIVVPSAAARAKVKARSAPLWLAR